MGIPQWIQGMLKDGQFRSVYDMALRLRIPPPTVYRWLSGESRPSLPYCIRLADGTDTPLEEVVRMAGLDDEEMPRTPEEETAAEVI